MYSVGIDIGYSSFKIVLLNDNYEIKYSHYLLHKGDVKEVFKKSIRTLLEHFNPQEISLGAVTGSGSEFLTQTGKIYSVNEVAATVEGSLAANKNIRSIIDIGGESAKYITGITKEDKSNIEIGMNSNCAAGTGSFLEEQMSRLNLRLEEYSDYAGRAQSIPRIAGRCSVFAKTDITHHQQEGVAVEDILLGLAYAVVKNYKGAVMKRLPVKKPLLFVGGTAHNLAIITAFKNILKLEEGELIIQEHFSKTSAWGSAIMARQNKMKMNLQELLTVLDRSLEQSRGQGGRLAPLNSFTANDNQDKHICTSVKFIGKQLEFYLGIDVGSTSTNLVLMNKNNEIAAFRYLKTFGDPVEAVRTGLKELQCEFQGRIDIKGVGTTGSGRYMIGNLIGADVVKDEITAQAKAATIIDNTVDTIFEIGGQDSKFISLEKGNVCDFQMNKICAAGTGSFLEEQAKKFDVPINLFGPMALDSDNPINLGERCTVFMETSMAFHLSGGAEIKDIAAGLCYSIAKNYLGRVVGQKKIGQKIFFQGGLAFNQGVINAFRILTGKEIIVPPFFSVTGAYGAAILAKEENSKKYSLFKGFEIETRESFLKKQKTKITKKENLSIFNGKINKLIFEGYDGHIDRKKQTVGIPRALFTFGMFPMFNAIFTELGFNVLLSEPTNEKTIALGQEYSMDETCYPIKLINGHVAELVSKNVDYIFFPDLYSVDHPGSASRKNYGCAYMQLSFKVINRAMDLEQRGIKLLSPTIAFSMGQKFMMKSFSKMGEQLGRSSEEMGKALQKGMKAILRFEERMTENSRNVVKELKPDEKAFVLISKIYGVADPVLNLGIPAKLMDMGYKVIPFFDLPEGNIAREYPNMFWPFGEHMLEPAQLVKQHPNLYIVLLTHHGCGPDSVLSHYIREIMNGKPFLHIEVDEHSSHVGVITRVEAFLNSLTKRESVKADEMEFYTKRIPHKAVNININLKDLSLDTSLYLPNLFPYAEISRGIMANRGILAEILPKTSVASLDTGRRFTITEESSSLTALLGDFFEELYKLPKSKHERIAFFVPRNEGTETDGQYSRLLRTKLDEEGFYNVSIVSPFMEDILFMKEADINAVQLGLMAGDLIQNAPQQKRNYHLSSLLDVINKNGLDLEYLKKMAGKINNEWRLVPIKKKILAIGEFNILFNNFLNNFTFKALEEEGHRVVYSSLSEAMWLFWRDYTDQNVNIKTGKTEQRLNQFKKEITLLSSELSGNSPFEKDLEILLEEADRKIRYYAGANGRYRAAKLSGNLHAIDGVITASSLYENTGIVLNILQKDFKKKEMPLLNLTFDGNRSENDKTKIESFMYYL